ncbi:MAG: TIR domain-containing protein, partial [Chloroflexi bacterium]|nr:TIR domain-containing protein [Chloroflexota bacterium]
RHIYIIHSRRDIDFVLRLAHDLRDSGADVWLDGRRFSGWEEWTRAVLQGIRQADLVLVCLSGHAVDSERFRRQISLANQEQKRMLTLLVESTFDQVENYSETQLLIEPPLIDFRGQYLSAFATLRRMLAKHVDGAVSPFMGMGPFQQLDADLFFGRDEALSEFIAALNAGQRFFVLSGPAGGGKTSFIQAGLIPALQKNALPESRHWIVAQLSLGDDPIQALARRLLPLLGKSPGPRSSRPFRSDPTAVLRFSERLLQDAPENCRLVLAIDQFESGLYNLEPDTRRHFLTLLRYAVSPVEDSQVVVVLASREEHIAELRQFAEWPELLQTGTEIHIPYLQDSELQRSIELQAEAGGISLENGLLTQLLADVNEGPFRLGLLQCVLYELRQRGGGSLLTLDTYQAIEEPKDVLIRQISAFFEAFGPREWYWFSGLMQHLVQQALPDSRATLRFQVSDLPPEANTVLDVLRRNRTNLMRVSHDIPITSTANMSVQLTAEIVARSWERFMSQLPGQASHVFGTQSLDAAVTVAPFSESASSDDWDEQEELFATDERNTTLSWNEALDRKVLRRAARNTSVAATSDRVDDQVQAFTEAAETDSSMQSPDEVFSDIVFLEQFSKSGARWIATLYLVAIIFAESITMLVDPFFGLILQSILLITMYVHAAPIWQTPLRRFILGLAMVPLIRLISLSVPVSALPQIYWYPLTGVLLLFAFLLAMRGMQLRPAAILFRFPIRILPVQLLIGVLGLGLGYIEYAILQPELIVDLREWREVIVIGAIVALSTGIVEELIFRGLLLSTAVGLFGKAGIIYQALVFATLHLGYESVVVCLVAFAIGMVFGWIVESTRSLVGVALAHGLATAVAIVIMPYMNATRSGPEILFELLG